MFKPFLVSIVLILIYAESPAVLSEGSQPQPSAQQNTKDNPSTTGNSKSSKTLQGGVQKFELTVEKMVDVGLDLKTAIKAANNLYLEVSVQPTRVITQPEMIGNGTIINVPIGTEPAGPPRPARKKYVDEYMNSMMPIIDNLKKNADDFVSGAQQWTLPPDIIAQLKPQLQLWVNTIDNIASLQTQLEQITIAPPYNNATIGELSNSLQKNLKDLDKIRLGIYRTIKKEGKRLSAP